MYNLLRYKLSFFRNAKRQNDIIEKKELQGMIRIYLSRKLGELRWTQADLARATGIRPSTINEYYHEIAERITLEHLDLICEALDCDLSEIIGRDPSPFPKTKMRTGIARDE